MFWQYARIISTSGGERKTNYGFISNIFRKLQSGKIPWSSSITELVKREKPNACAYCGSSRDLAAEYMLPRRRGGDDVPENAVRVCADCRSRKGNKRLYEWYGLENMDKLHRITEAKYLKLLYSLHKARGTLAATPADLCSHCDLASKCLARGELSVYCLEGQFRETLGSATIRR